MTAVEEQITVRDRLALALDVPSLSEALRLAKPVAPHFGVTKVGLQLYTSSGPAAVEAMVGEGFKVFLDLKLHDIPNTVRSAAIEVAKLGVSYITVHASGGREMLAAAVEGLTVGAEAAGLPVPTALAVTVLTSDVDAPPDLLGKRVGDAVAAGCPGLVCAAPDLPTVKGIAPDLVAVTPGIRMPGGDAHDQKRIATPSSALADGADLLVIGRAVTGADDIEAAALAVVAEASGAG